jgi:hypothetical protein
VIALQPPEVLDPSTPEGAAQGYFQAVHDGDGGRIAVYLTQDLNERCDLGRYEEGRAASVVILRTDVAGDSATVDVTITVAVGDAPFDVESYSRDERLVMEHDGDRWLISEVPWPWDRYLCDNEA